jgi:hypothetical protein
MWWCATGRSECHRRARTGNPARAMCRSLLSSAPMAQAQARGTRGSAPSRDRWQHGRGLLDVDLHRQLVFLFSVPFQQPSGRFRPGLTPLGSGSCPVFNSTASSIFQSTLQYRGGCVCSPGGAWGEEEEGEKHLSLAYKYEGRG